MKKRSTTLLLSALVCTTALAACGDDKKSGGSSDAATTLIALNVLWRTGLERGRLQALGLRLGADVPVFVFGRSAFAEGVGEKLQAIELPPASDVVGPIGALTLLAVKAAGAGQIFVSEPNAFRRKMAKELVPSAIVIDPLTENVPGIIHSMTEEGVGVDVALECVGLEASLNTCAASVRRQGKVVQTGLHMKPASIDAMLWALKDITVEATWCYPVQSWPRIIRMVESGSFPIEKIVTANISADNVVKQGFDALLDKSVNHMKILVTV